MSSAYLMSGRTQQQNLAEAVFNLGWTHSMYQIFTEKTFRNIGHIILLSKGLNMILFASDVYVCIFIGCESISVHLILFGSIKIPLESSLH
jgi:hypothetical protein